MATAGKGDALDDTPASDDGALAPSAAVSPAKEAGRGTKGPSNPTPKLRSSARRESSPKNVMGVASDSSHDEKEGEGDAKSKGGGNDGPSDATSGENAPTALRRSSRPARYRAAAAAAGTASNTDSPVVTPKSTPKAKRATSSDKKSAKKGEAASKTPTPQGGNGTWTDEEREQFREGVVLHGWGNWIHIQLSVPTRTRSQIKSHAQKFSKHHGEEKKRLEKEHRSSLGSSGSSTKRRTSESPPEKKPEKGSESPPKKKSKPSPPAKKRSKPSPPAKKKSKPSPPAKKAAKASVRTTEAALPAKEEIAAAVAAATATVSELANSAIKTEQPAKTTKLEPPVKEVAKPGMVTEPAASPKEAKAPAAKAEVPANEEPSAEGATAEGATVEKTPSDDASKPTTRTRSKRAVVAPTKYTPPSPVKREKKESSPPAQQKIKGPANRVKELPDLSKRKIRGPVNRSKDTDGPVVMGSGAWTPEEQAQFERGCILHGWGRWAKVTPCIPTRTHAQVKSHAQKWNIWRGKDKERLCREHERHRRSVEQYGEDEAARRMEKRKAKKEKKKKRKAVPTSSRRLPTKRARAELLASPMSPRPRGREETKDKPPSVIKSPARTTTADFGAAEAILALNFSSWDDRDKSGEGAESATGGESTEPSGKAPDDGKDCAASSSGEDESNSGSDASIGSQEDERKEEASALKSDEGGELNAPRSSRRTRQRSSASRYGSQPPPHWLATDTWEECQDNIRRWNRLSREEKGYECQEYDRLPGREKERLKDKLVNLMCNQPSP